MSGHEEHHIIGPKVYIPVFAALIVLLFATVGASYLDISTTVNLIIALAIAVAKALLIILFFMHVKYSSKLVKVFAGAGFLWLLILFALIIMDFVSRDQLSAFVN